MSASTIASDPLSEAARVPSRLLILAAAAGGCAVAAVSLILALTNEVIGADLGEPLVIALLADWITLSYILGGAVAWWCRPASRFGPLMVTAGFVNFLATLSWAENPAVFTIGQALDLIPPVLFLHLYLAFPDGRLHGRERVLVWAAYAVAIVLELVRMGVGGFGPNNLLELTVDPDLQQTVRNVQLTAVSAACLVGVVVLAVRRNRSGPPLRRSLDVLTVAFSLSLVLIATLLLSATYGGPWVAQIRWITYVALGLAPFALVLGLLRARLARSSVGDLMVELHQDASPARLQGALARALRDESLQLAYWLPEFGNYGDLDGRVVHLPADETNRSVTVIERDGVRIAAIVHDPSLQDEPALLEAVTAGAGIALENAQLHAELRARLDELQGSRARILDAGRTERKRLERNLHDGAQQRLIALSLELNLLENVPSMDPTAAARIAAARQEIAASLDELREVARGLHPAVVSGHGLEVALEQLVAHAPVPIHLKVDIGSRLDEALEVAVYYLVSESLANVAKHARASSGSVGISVTASTVVVEIVDDGVGGADTERGTGLRGLADRVETLGGRLRVWSPAGGGTRVRAEIPCVP